MLPLRFAYLTFSLIFFIPWLIFYYARKDLRKQMLAMSLFFSIVGLIAQYLWWTRDWWKPETVTGTVIGFEDFLLGFTNGGIAAVIYEEVFRKRIYHRDPCPHAKQTLFVILLTFVLMGFSFWIVKDTSFMATVIGLVVTGVILLILRRDLFVSSITNGFLMAIISLPVYYLSLLISPTFIQKTWLLPNLSGISLTGIPIEDIIFYFLVGFVAAPLYEYWQGLALRNMTSKGKLKKSKSL